MFSYVARRMAYSIPVLLIASFLLFGFVRATFDPTARLRSSRDPSAVERERTRLGLDKPLVVQYKDWLVKFVQGDWGESSRSSEPVYPMITRALWNTFQLIFWGVLISGLIAIGIGIFSAVRQYSVADYAFTSASFIGLAMPPFWFGLIVTEKIFSIPGMGQLFFDSLLQGDANVLVAWTVVTAGFVILFNLVADIGYGALDPRIRVA